MIRTTLAGLALAVSLAAAGCSKQPNATPEKATQAAAPAAAPALADDPPNIEPVDEPSDPVIDNDESAGVKDPPADEGDKHDPDESEEGDYE